MTVAILGGRGVAVAASPPVATPGLQSAAVTLDGVAGRVRKVQLRVPENPAEPRGRSLVLTALVLEADQAQKRADPILVFQGGPGQSATQLAAFYAQFFAGLRATRDVVLMDQRGTGESNPLMARVAPERLFDELGAIVPASWIAPTLDSLRTVADLTQYTTRRIVDDADALIRALHYERVNLYGTSYGTRCALDFMRQHPEHVRSAVIKNVMPMRAIIPLSYAANAQRALDLLFADVGADSAAHASYPGARAELDTVLGRLERAPVHVAVTNPLTGQEREVELTRPGVAMTLRMLLMTMPTRATIPFLIDRAAAGSWRELATQMATLRVAYARTLALGMSMCVVASEDCPRLTPELIEADIAHSFLRDAAASAFQKVCDVWPRGSVAAGFSTPVQSRIPTLLVSGRLDPATPPEWAEEVRRDLPNSTHVVFRHAAHPNAGFEGLDALVANFVESGSPRGLDSACAEAGQAPPFKLPAP